MQKPSKDLTLTIVSLSRTSVKNEFLWSIYKISAVIVALMPVIIFSILVQGGDYIGAVLDRNNAENISRVLYPNDNVSSDRIIFNSGF